MDASSTMIGLIFGIYPLVVFVVSPVIGVLVSYCYFMSFKTEQTKIKQNKTVH